MRLLLDTQALIWSLNDSERLTSTARTNIQKAGEVYMSPINFYEIAIKTALGRDIGIQGPIHKIIRTALSSGFLWLPLTAHHIDAYLSVPLYDHHRDPFDRMLLATALADGLTIVSSDHNFPLYKDLVTIVW